MTLLEMGQAAKAASQVLAVAETMQKNEALAAMAKSLKFHEPDILAANEQDVAARWTAALPPARPLSPQWPSARSTRD